MTESADRPKPPDLQEWIRRFGGYHNIPWPEWDAANAEYQCARRDYLPAVEMSPRKRGGAP
jgi:hypothetical protein